MNDHIVDRREPTFAADLHHTLQELGRYRQHRESPIVIGQSYSRGRQGEIARSTQMLAEAVTAAALGLALLTGILSALGSVYPALLLPVSALPF